MTQQLEYTAEDGLKLLEYLGIIDMSKTEIELFKDKWREVYSSRRNLIGVTWTIYAEILPFIRGDDEVGSAFTARLRDRDFGERLDSTELEQQLHRGIPLAKIFERSHE